MQNLNIHIAFIGILFLFGSCTDNIEQRASDFLFSKNKLSNEYVIDSDAIQKIEIKTYKNLKLHQNHFWITLKDVSSLNPACLEEYIIIEKLENNSLKKRSGYKNNIVPISSEFYSGKFKNEMFKECWRETEELYVKFSPAFFRKIERNYSSTCVPIKEFEYFPEFKIEGSNTSYIKFLNNDVIEVDTIPERKEKLPSVSDNAVIEFTEYVYPETIIYDTLMFNSGEHPVKPRYYSDTLKNRKQVYKEGVLIEDRCFDEYFQAYRIIQYLYNDQNELQKVTVKVVSDSEENTILNISLNYIDNKLLVTPKVDNMLIGRLQKKENNTILFSIGLDIDEPLVSIYSEQQFSYTYDENGNWVTRTEINSYNEIESITKRTIDYNNSN